MLFDLYFPGLLPPNAVTVPQYVRDQWTSFYVPRITMAFAARPAALDQLLRVSRAPFDPADADTKVATALGLLWYNAFATMDGISTLRGQPFDNTTRFYTGSGNDFLLNLLVKRYRANPVALQEIEGNYQTSGRLGVPLVTLHTTADPIVPYWHEPLYSLKALLGGSGLLHDEPAGLPLWSLQLRARRGDRGPRSPRAQGGGAGAAERREGPDDGEVPRAVPIAGQGERPAALRISSLSPDPVLTLERNAVLQKRRP